MKKKVWGKGLAVTFLAGAIWASMLTGCSSGEPVKEAAESAVTESSSESTVAEGSPESPLTEETAGLAATQVAAEGEAVAAAEEIIGSDALKAVYEDLEPFEGDMQVVLHSSSGEETVLHTPVEEEAKASLSALAGKNRNWIGVKYASTTSTLQVDGYNYSVWNMLDWDTRTCWAEGEPRSEGLWEGFTYYFAGNRRIDGFRIYPGYQKSVRVYRNNIYPRGLVITAGGYEIDCDLDPYVNDITRDGDYYWVDIYFSSPVYDDQISVMIGAVGTYGSDPDKDCCITEFHPFYY